MNNPEIPLKAGAMYDDAEVMADRRLTAWLDWGRRTRRWADSTCGDYARKARAWLDWLAEHDIPPKRAKPAHVEAWLDSLYPSPSVRSGAQTAVIAFYDWKIGKSRNPARGVERVPVRRSVPRSLESGEPATVISAAARYGPRWSCYSGFLFYAGLRRAEGCTVRWVDLEGGIRWLRIVGKGGREAVVPIHDRLRGLILAWRAAGPSPVWVFPGRDGSRPMSVATATKWMRQILDDAGLPHATPHWARHTFGSSILAASGDVAATQAALRHESLSSTTVYVRARDAQVAKAVATLAY